MTTKTLTQKRIIVLRSEMQAASTIAALSALGANVVSLPLFHYSEDEDYAQITPAAIADYHTIIFTSANAVTFFFQALGKHSLHSQCIAVGSKTAECLEQHWQQSNIAIPKVASQEGILALLPTDLCEQRILLPTTRDARLHLPQQLKLRGALVDTWYIYQGNPAEVDWPILEPGDYVIFTSSQQVNRFFAYYTDPLPDNMVIFCIGQQTKAHVLPHFSGKIIVPETTSMEGIITSISTII